MKYLLFSLLIVTAGYTARSQTTPGTKMIVTSASDLGIQAEPVQTITKSYIQVDGSVHLPATARLFLTACDSITIHGNFSTAPGTTLVLGAGTAICSTAKSAKHLPAKPAAPVTNNKPALVPNPVVGSFRILVPFSGNYTFQLFSSDGIRMQSGSFSGTNTEVDVHDFAAGFYVAVITCPDSLQQWQLKFIKQ